MCSAAHPVPGTLRRVSNEGGWGVGVRTDVGSPEHANAHIDSLRGGPPDEDPPPRPSCLWTLVALFVVVALIVIAIWVIGLVTGGR
jgi:hypothetical protein